MGQIFEMLSLVSIHIVLFILKHQISTSVLGYYMLKYIFASIACIHLWSPMFPPRQYKENNICISRSKDDLSCAQNMMI